MNKLDLLIFSKLTDQIKNTKLLGNTPTETFYVCEGNETSFSAYQEGIRIFYCNKYSFGLYFITVILAPINTESMEAVELVDLQSYINGLSTGVISVLLGIDQTEADYLTFTYPVSFLDLITANAVIKTVQKIYSLRVASKTTLLDYIKKVGDIRALESEYNVEPESETDEEDSSN